ncbi:hypothetical protein V1477_011635 [Vespula maculifrons]|uniref:Uncharacterized protein n=1 Tax=Vespula maculifrons TaxID=7453 RepID=A0ABD2BZT2_VESMC
MMLDRKFSCTICSIYENPCLTKSWVVLLPLSVKSMSNQKLGYTTSSIDENQRPAKNSVVLLPPSVKVEVGPKTRLYYFLHRRKSSSDQKLGCTTSSIDKNRCSTKNSAVLLSPWARNYRPTKISSFAGSYSQLYHLLCFPKIVRPTKYSALPLSLRRFHGKLKYACPSPTFLSFRVVNGDGEKDHVGFPGKEEKWVKVLYNKIGEKRLRDKTPRFTSYHQCAINRFRETFEIRRVSENTWIEVRD